jgi:2-keto-4-pentenoate hydratase/2-oxohepta-3-ene-1,7-dioic acid hydratase in catechol pathway
LESNAAKLPKVKAGFRYGAPFTRPSKIICVGLNFAKHAAESNMQLPKEPILFFKSTSALCGPNDDLLIPGKLSWLS